MTCVQPNAVVGCTAPPRQTTLVQPSHFFYAPGTLRAMSLTAITVLIVPKNEAHAMQSTLKRNGLLHKAYRSSPAGQNGLEIPLGSPDLSLLPESILSRLVEVDSSESEGQVRVASRSPLALAPVKSHISHSVGVNAIRTYLQKHHNLTANELNSIPAKWLKYGDILVLFGNDESPVLVPPNLVSCTND